jgi:hypothetical protein
MSDFFDEGSEFDPGEEAPYQSQPSPSERASSFTPYDVKEDELTLPSTFSGGIDRLRSQRERKIASLRQQAAMSPVYQDDQGRMSRTAPIDNRGWYQPLGGEAYQVEDDSFTPVQEKMARQLEQTMPVSMVNGQLSNQEIWKNRGTIFNKLMEGNEGKPLTSESFADNPYWDEIKHSPPCNPSS